MKIKTCLLIKNVYKEMRQEKGLHRRCVEIYSRSASSGPDCRHSQFLQLSNVIVGSTCKFLKPIAMNKLIFTLLASLVMLSLSAQRVDLDRFNFTASFREFPDEPLPKEYKTYNVRIEAAPSLGLGYSTAGLENNINIDRKSTRLNSSHLSISAADFCLKKK